MEINLQGGVIPQALPGARSPDFPVKKTETSAGNTADAPTMDAIEVKRVKQLQSAAVDYFKDVFKDVYAVSDSRFTIFKDTSGQYITRYTSLRDGRVTYIPEPQMLQYMERAQAARRALVEIEA